MRLAGEIEMDAVTYRRMVLAAVGPRIWITRTLGIMLLLFTAAGIVSIYNENIHGRPIFHDAGMNVLELALFLCLGIYLLTVYRLGAWRNWRRLGGVSARPWRYEVSESTLDIHSPQGDVSLRWEATTRVRTRSNAWIARTKTRQLVVVPRAAFSPADAMLLDEFVKSLANASVN